MNFWNETNLSVSPGLITSDARTDYLLRLLLICKNIPLKVVVYVKLNDTTQNLNLAC